MQMGARVMDTCKARALITDTVPLAQLPACFEALRQPTHQCKVMVSPWE